MRARARLRVRAGVRVRVAGLACCCTSWPASQASEGRAGMLYGMRGCGGSASARMLSASFPPAFLRADQPQLCEEEEEVVDFDSLLCLAAASAFG